MPVPPVDYREHLWQLIRAINGTQREMMAGWPVVDGRTRAGRERERMAKTLRAFMNVWVVIRERRELLRHEPIA